MSNLAFLSIAEAAKRIRTKKLSPVELTKALIAHTERHDNRIHAYIRTTPDIALREAKAAEAEIMAGGYRGPLHGIPYALKDIIDYAGLPTTAHSKVLIDNIAREDAETTRRLKAAGGIMMGKLATHEFAFGGPSFDLPWPPAVNPWGERLIPGGSSSGSGAAVGAGFVPAALGTDTGGSVRNPASMCGITGLKPTYGLVSRRGVVALSYQLDHVGPMTRDVTDNALLLQVIAGYDAQDEGSTEAPAANYAGDLGKGLKGLIVGYIRHFHTEDDTAHPEQAAALDAAAETLKALGAEVREIRLPPLADFHTCSRIIIRSEAFAIHRYWLAERPGDYGELGRQRIMDGATVLAADYVDALRLRGRLTRKVLEAFAGIDVALVVSSFDPPCSIDDRKSVSAAYFRQARHPFNVSGLPALAIPAGFTKDGRPLSLQIVGHPFQEAMIYRVAYAYEQEKRWIDRHPPALV